MHVAAAGAGAVAGAAAPHPAQPMGAGDEDLEAILKLSAQEAAQSAAPVLGSQRSISRQGVFLRNDQHQV